LLAAGAGESGKSTVLKQMKLIYAQGFSKNEKNEWKPVIFGNIIQSFRLIFDAMNEMGIMLENEENEASNSHIQHPIVAPSPPEVTIAEGILAAAW
jgi:guanine nucleotide-binding protein subunit alpha